jgi:hypothetical protein
MPGAGFYAIETSKLSFRSDGRWYADDDPVLHPRLARLFSRYLRRKPSGEAGPRTVGSARPLPVGSLDGAVAGGSRATCSQSPAPGGYEIWIDERYHADVEIEDTPYVVTSVHADSAQSLSIELNDGTTEGLDPDTLEVGAGNVLYCAVKQGTEWARFLRPAYYQLAHFIEEPAPGRFLLRCGGTTHTIGQR